MLHCITLFETKWFFSPHVEYLVLTLLCFFSKKKSSELIYMQLILIIGMMNPENRTYITWPDFEYTQEDARINTDSTFGQLITISLNILFSFFLNPVNSYNSGLPSSWQNF